MSTVSPLTSDEMSRVRAAIHQRGERAVLTASGVSRNALSRALAGLPVRAGTTQLIRSALAGLTANSPLSGAA